jgi:hypothetical protein
MCEMLDNFESYILNEANMQDYLKYKLTDVSENSKQVKTNYNKTNYNVEVKKQNIFVPREQDSLFWCYYIIKNGDIKYETINNKNTLITKQMKIELVSKIRENKQTVKTYKFDTISNIESNLANDNIITVKSFMSLCAIDNINIVFVSKKTYFECLTNDSEPIYIIQEIDRTQLKYNKQYGYEIASEDILNEIHSNLYKVDSLNKPIKAASSYKVSDLLEIAHKLAIEVVNKETGKNKTKNELYEAIIQYF